MRVLATIAFIILCLTGMASAVVELANMFRAAACRKPGTSLYVNPFNILLEPAKLTAPGLAARRWIFYGLVGFIVCGAAALVVGITTGVAH